MKTKKTKGNGKSFSRGRSIGVVGRPLMAGYQLEIAVRVLGCAGASGKVRAVANELVLGYLSLS